MVQIFDRGGSKDESGPPDAEDPVANLFLSRMIESGEVEVNLDDEVEDQSLPNESDKTVPTPKEDSQPWKFMKVRGYQECRQEEWEADVIIEGYETNEKRPEFNTVWMPRDISYAEALESFVKRYDIGMVRTELSYRRNTMLVEYVQPQVWYSRALYDPRLYPLFQEPPPGTPLVTQRSLTGSSSHRSQGAGSNFSTPRRRTPRHDFKQEAPNRLQRQGTGDIKVETGGGKAEGMEEEDEEEESSEEEELWDGEWGSPADLPEVAWQQWPIEIGWKQRVLIENEVQWNEITESIPWTRRTTMQLFQSMTRAKLLTPDLVAKHEGAIAVWELASQRSNHHALCRDTPVLISILKAMSVRESEDLDMAQAEVDADMAEDRRKKEEEEEKKKAEEAIQRRLELASGKGGQASAKRGGAPTRVPLSELKAQMKGYKNIDMKGKEVPASVKVWLKQVDRVLGEVSIAAVAAVWTLGATQEARESLVMLNAHHFILHLMGLLLVRHRVRKEFCVEELMEKKFINEVEQHMAKKGEEKKSRLSHHSVSLKMGLEKASMAEWEAKLFKDEDPPIAPSPRLRRDLSTGEQSPATPGTPGTPSPGKRDVGAITNAIVSFVRSSEASRIWYAKTKYRQIKQTRDHAVELEAYVIGALGVLLLHPAVRVALASHVEGMFAVRSLKEPKNPDQVRYQMNRNLWDEDIPSKERVYTVSRLFFRNLTGWHLLVLGAQLPKESRAQGMARDTCELYARCLATNLARGKGHQTLFKELVGMQGLQALLDTQNTEVKRCASSALSLFVGRGSASNPMLVGNSAPVMLRMTLSLMHRVLHPKVGHKANSSRFIKAALNVMDVTKPEVIETLSNSAGCIWPCAEEALKHEAQLGEVETQLLLDLTEGSIVHSARFGSVVCEILIHTLVLFTTSPRLGKMMVDYKVLRTLQLVLKLKATSSQVRYAGIGCLCILLQHAVGAESRLSIDDVPAPQLHPPPPSTPRGAFPEREEAKAMEKEERAGEIPPVFTYMSGPFRQALYPGTATGLLKSLPDMESADIKGARSVVSACLMYLATVPDEHWPLADLTRTVALLNKPLQLEEMDKPIDPHVVQYSAATLWLLARTQSNRYLFSKTPAMSLLLETALNPPRGRRAKSPLRREEMDEETARKEELREENEAHWGMAQLWCTAAVTLLVCDKHTRILMDSFPELLQKIYKLLSTDCALGVYSSSIQECMRWQLVGCLFVYAASDKSRSDTVSQIGIGEYLKQVACEERASLRLRLRAAELYLHLATTSGELADPGDGSHEGMLAALLKSDEILLLEFSCLACAFLASFQPWRRETLTQDAKIVPLLLQTINKLDPNRPQGRAAPLKALLNLSTDSHSQRVICHLGLQLLLQVAVASENTEEIKHVARCILSNVVLNFHNRTDLYKAELSTKSKLASLVVSSSYTPHSPLEYGLSPSFASPPPPPPILLQPGMGSGMTQHLEEAEEFDPSDPLSPPPKSDKSFVATALSKRETGKLYDSHSPGGHTSLAARFDSWLGDTFPDVTSPDWRPYENILPLSSPPDSLRPSRHQSRPSSPGLSPRASPIQDQSVTVKSMKKKKTSPIGRGRPGGGSHTNSPRKQPSPSRNEWDLEVAAEEAVRQEEQEELEEKERADRETQLQLPASDGVFRKTDTKWLREVSMGAGKELRFSLMQGLSQIWDQGKHMGVPARPLSAASRSLASTQGSPPGSRPSSAMMMMNHDSMLRPQSAMTDFQGGYSRRGGGFGHHPPMRPHSSMGFSGSGQASSLSPQGFGTATSRPHSATTYNYDDEYDVPGLTGNSDRSDRVPSPSHTPRTRAGVAGKKEYASGFKRLRAFKMLGGAIPGADEGAQELGSEQGTPAKPSKDSVEGDGDGEAGGDSATPQTLSKQASGSGGDFAGGGVGIPGGPHPHPSHDANSQQYSNGPESTPMRPPSAGPPARPPSASSPFRPPSAKRPQSALLANRPQSAQREVAFSNLSPEEQYKASMMHEEMIYEDTAGEEEERDQLEAFPEHPEDVDMSLALRSHSAMSGASFDSEYVREDPFWSPAILHIDVYTAAGGGPVADPIAAIRARPKSANRMAGSGVRAAKGLTRSGLRDSMHKQKEAMQMTRSQSAPPQETKAAEATKTSVVVSGTAPSAPGSGGGGGGRGEGDVSRSGRLSEVSRSGRLSESTPASAPKKPKSEKEERKDLRKKLHFIIRNQDGHLDHMLERDAYQEKRSRLKKNKQAKPPLGGSAKDSKLSKFKKITGGSKPPKSGDDKKSAEGGDAGKSGSDDKKRAGRRSSVSSITGGEGTASGAGGNRRGSISSQSGGTGRRGSISQSGRKPSVTPSEGVDETPRERRLSIAESQDSEEGAGGGAAAESKTDTYKASNLRARSKDGHIQPCGCTMCQPASGGSGTVLDVQLLPYRTRNRFKFNDTEDLGGRWEGRNLEKFKHVEGCEMCRGLFEHYVLPTGETVHLFLPQRQLVDEIDVTLGGPPAAPLDLESIGIQDLPLPPEALYDLTMKVPNKPPPYKPPPAAPPRPARHTLDVGVHECGKSKDNPEQTDITQCTHHGLPKTPPIALIITRNVYKVVEERPDCKWELANSIFQPRMRSSKMFFDKPKPLIPRMFAKDWHRMILKPANHKAFSRQGGDNEVLEIKAITSEYHETVVCAYYYYCCVHSEGPFFMDENSFRMFLEETDIASPAVQTSRQKELTDMFYAAFLKANENSTEAKLKLPTKEVVLLRFEFLEIIIRLAIFRMKGFKARSIPNAVEILFEEILNNAIPDEACMAMNANDFRKERMYTQGVDDVLSAHSQLLQSLFDLYRGGAARLSHESCMQILQNSGMFRYNLTRNEAKWCICLSRMLVVDDISQRDQHTGLTYVDFLESLCRCVDVQSIALPDDIQNAVGVRTVWEYLGEGKKIEDQKKKKAIDNLFSPVSPITPGFGAERKRIPRRPSTGLLPTKTRPLEDKLEQVFEQLLIPSLCQFYQVNMDDEDHELNLVNMLKTQSNSAQEEFSKRQLASQQINVSDSGPSGVELAAEKSEASSKGGGSVGRARSGRR